MAGAAASVSSGDLMTNARKDIVDLVRLLKRKQDGSCQTKALERIRSSCRLQNAEATFKLRERLAKLYAHDSLSAEQVQQRLDATLDWVKHHAPLIMHMHAGHILKFLEKDPVMKNQFETFSSGGACAHFAIFPLNNLFAHSPNHSLTHSLTHSLADFLTHLLTH